MNTDLHTFKELCIKNDMDYNSTLLYSTETNNVCGIALWLKVGHVEFDLHGKLTNVVTY